MPCLSESDRKRILEFARQGVVEAVCHKRLLQDIPKAEVFEPRCGVFVTLNVAGKLRGCIGVIEAKESLGASIAKCARRTITGSCPPLFPAPWKSATLPRPWSAYTTCQK